MYRLNGAHFIRSFIRLITLGRVTYPIDTYKPSNMPTDDFLATKENLTAGFHIATANDLFSNGMIQILDDVCAVTASMQIFALATIPPAIQQDFASRLLILSSDHRCPASSRSYSLFEKGLCLALITFVGLAAFTLQSWTSDVSSPLLGSAHLGLRIHQILERDTGSRYEC
jgi:hypothetical protein